MKSTTPFVKRYFKKLSGGVILLLLLIAGAVFLFGIITHEVLWEKEEELDRHVFNLLSVHFVSPQLTVFMKAITYCASSRFLQVAYAVLVLSYLAAKNWKRAIEISVVGLGGFFVNYFMKISFERTRPANPLVEPLQNFSYPSGHATSGFIFYGLLVYLVWKSGIANIYKNIIAIVLILFSILIGFSRIYLRLHYTSDVIAGFCIGFIWLLLCVWLMEYLKKKSEFELKQARI
jgi:membrane-associated phospholipid phosphatase